jgi:hypothetical protein
MTNDMSWKRGLFRAWVVLSTIWVVALAVSLWASWQTALVMPKPTGGEVFYTVSRPWWFNHVRVAILAIVPPVLVFAIGWILTRLFLRPNA